MIVYISIGNSDDKLSQKQWADFQTLVCAVVEEFGSHIHGRWYSAPTDPYQNACYCVDFPDEHAPELTGQLAALAQIFKQDAIAWAPAPATTFLGAKTYTVAHHDNPGDAALLGHDHSDRWTGGDRKDEQ